MTMVSAGELQHLIRTHHPEYPPGQLALAGAVLAGAEAKAALALAQMLDGDFAGAGRVVSGNLLAGCLLNAAFEAIGTAIGDDTQRAELASFALRERIAHYCAVQAEIAGEIPAQ